MNNKINKIFILIAFVSLLISSCGVKYEFNSTYHKNKNYEVSIDLPKESKLLKSVERDFDKDGTIEKLDIIITGLDDDNCANCPIKYIIYQKDENKKWQEVDSVYPFNYNDNIVVPYLYSGNIGEDRLDIFIDNDKDLTSIYYEETAKSGKIADGKSFCLIVYKFINNKLTKDNETVSYAGSMPDLDTLLSSFKEYNNNPSIESDFDDKVTYEITKRIVDELEYFEIDCKDIGFNNPISNNSKYKRLVRLTRTETNTDDMSTWLNDDDNQDSFGNIKIKN